jgi:outer membrane receptor for ferrienterochelin and colicins
MLKRAGLMLQWALLAFALSQGSPEVASAQGPTVLPEIQIRDERDQDLRLKKFEINRVERLSTKSLEKKKALSFAQAIANERGIDTQTACAFCGAKRVTINGLKGEHTTILIDGLSLHSAVSSFYGVEAIPMSIIDSMDVYRGAGSTLTAPESIGGAINLVTKPILTTGGETSAAISEDGEQRFSILGTKRFESGSGLMLALEHNNSLPLDLDSNGIAEVPRQQTAGVSLKFTDRFNEKHDLSVRFGFGQVKTIGGTMQELRITQAPSPTVSPDDFEDRDTRKKYLGPQAKITDHVDLTRQEAAVILKSDLTQDSSLKLAIGLAGQVQNSIYSHGYDYDNRDQLFSGTAEYQKILNETHLVSVGLDTKSERMRSQSKSLFDNRGLARDDLDSGSVGIFAQDIWTYSDRLEVSLALRVDNIRTHWLALDRELERTVFAPRIQLKKRHDEHFTSRLALGVGYRSPLTLFESQHGSDHNGFLIDLHELETAQSLVYSLAGQWQDDFFEAGIHLTQIQNMAYGEDRALTNDPTIFKNSKDNYLVSVYDLSYGRRLTPEWTIEGTFEFFEYPQGYKEKLPVAAIERRLLVTSNVDWAPWTFSQKVIFIGARDLAAYGYDKHYNVAPSEDPLDPSFGGGGEAQKLQKSPHFATLDLEFKRTLGSGGAWTSLSVLNAFDYTQTGEGDSPTTWDQHGSHFHLDNFHIWGPLRGRQIFFAIGAEI